MDRSNAGWSVAGINSRTLLWLLLACAGALRLVLARHLIPDGLFDDGYITFRYARNLVRGLGLVFNPGEHVLGTTSPLMTFLLAAGARIVGVNFIEQLAAAIDILASLGSIYFSERALRLTQVPEEVVWTFVSVLCFLPSFISNATSGMETPLVLFLMALSFYFFVTDNLLALGITGGLLFLSRIDTGIWLLALGITILSAPRPQRKPFSKLLRPLLVFCVIVGAWLGFTQLYFGSVIPQSVVGKAVSHAAFVLPDWNYTLTFLSAFVPALRFGLSGLLVVAVAFLLLLPPAIDLFKGYPLIRPLVLFFPLYVLLFLASHAPLFSWYVMPPKWAFYLLALYALWFYALRLTPVFRLPVATVRLLPVLGAVLLVLGVLAVKRDVSTPVDYVGVPISHDIQRNLRPDATIFLEHIGLIGYRTDRYIFDYMGLVTPETTRLRRQYGSDWLPKAARKYDADLVLLYDSDIPVIQSQQEDALWFQSHYSHLRDYPLPGLTVYAFLKHPSPAAPPAYP